MLLEQNRTILKDRSVVVYLRATPADIFRSIGSTGGRRPLIDVEDPTAEISRLLKERESLYREVADVSIDTTDKSLREVAELVVEELVTRGYLH